MSIKKNRGQRVQSQCLGEGGRSYLEKAGGGVKKNRAFSHDAKIHGIDAAHQKTHLQCNQCGCLCSAASKGTKDPMKRAKSQLHKGPLKYGLRHSFSPGMLIGNLGSNNA